MQTTKLKCKHGCGYENEHRGGMNIHENVHCPKLKNSTPAKSKKTSGSKDSGVTKKTASVEKTEPKCECEPGEARWRFLNKADPLEAHIAGQGYKKICDECDEVI